MAHQSERFRGGNTGLGDVVELLCYSEQNILNWRLPILYSSERHCSAQCTSVPTLGLAAS
jgi:hypothetical protein